MTGSAEFGEGFRRTFVLLLLLVVAGVFVAMIRSFLIALFLAAVFAGLIYPAQRWVSDRLRGHDHLAAVIVLIGFVLAVGVPMLIMLGLVAAEAVQISAKVMPWIRDQLQGGAALAGDLPAWLPYADELEPYRRTILEKLGQGVAAVGRVLVGGIPDLTQGTIDVLLDAFIMLYAMFFFLAEGPEWLAKAKRYVPLGSDERDTIVDRGFAVTRAALKGILVIGLLQGILVALAFWAAGIQGAAFWGAIVLILSAVPALGSGLVWGPAAIYLFVTGDTGWAIAMVVWGVVIVGIVDNVLRPIVVGRDAKLPDLVILISTLGGIAVFGVAGILIGPIVAAILSLLLNVYHAAFAQALPEKSAGPREPGIE